MEDGLAFALMFLAYTFVILAIILTIFIVLLIKDIRDLSQSYTKLCDTVQKEIQPTLEEIKKALVSVNGLASGVDKQLTAVKSSFNTLQQVLGSAFGGLKGVSTSLLGGFLAGYKMFVKKK